MSRNDPADKSSSTLREPVSGVRERNANEVDLVFDLDGDDSGDEEGGGATMVANLSELARDAEMVFGDEPTNPGVDVSVVLEEHAGASVVVSNELNADEAEFIARQQRSRWVGIGLVAIFLATLTFTLVAMIL